MIIPISSSSEFSKKKKIIAKHATFRHHYQVVASGPLDGAMNQLSADVRADLRRLNAPVHFLRDVY